VAIWDEFSGSAYFTIKTLAGVGVPGISTVLPIITLVTRAAKAGLFVGALLAVLTWRARGAWHALALHQARVETGRQNVSKRFDHFGVILNFPGQARAAAQNPVKILGTPRAIRAISFV